jgi:hypothetical protein
MAHYTLDCVEARERPIDPRDAEIARLAEENRVLVAFVEAYIAHEPDDYASGLALSDKLIGVAQIVYRHREEVSR